MKLTKQEKIEIKKAMNAVQDGIAKANKFGSWEELKNWGDGSFLRAMDVRVKCITKKLIDAGCIL